MSLTRNQSILQFLKYYTENPSLDYAVLLDGPWGSGKTHLIRAFLESREGKHLSVSLYGMTSVSQIEDEFFRLLHPVLSSKPFKIMGVFARGLAKGALKIDLSKEESFTAALPDFNLKEFLKCPADQLLVFDDLERCMMPISEVLGYINTFVENDGMKVILLANEAEIIKRDERFPEIKEKLIGQTLCVHADAEGVYSKFLEQIADENARALLAAEQQRALVIHAQSQTNNLRILKQAMWDFERLAGHLNSDQWSNSAGLRDLLSISLAMSMEIRSGRIRIEDLPKLNTSSFARYVRSKKQEAPEIDERFEKRYPDLTLAGAAFRPDVLGQIFIKGLTEPDLVQATLKESRQFASKNELPAWKRAWYGFESNDVDFEAALAEVERDFVARRIASSHVLYHVFGIRLNAADIGALNKSREEILKEGKAYIDDLITQDKIISSLIENPKPDFSRSYDGLGYSNGETAEFCELVEYYVSAANNKAEATYPELARAVLNKVDAEPDEFLFDLCTNAFRTSPYYNVPILAALSPNDFVSKVMSVSPRTQIRMLDTLYNRYEFNRLSGELACERPWLEKVRKLLTEKAEEAKPMTRHRLISTIKRRIDPLFPEPIEQIADESNKLD